MIRARDVLAFHDLDGDGTLTKDEMVESMNSYALDARGAGVEPRAAAETEETQADRSGSGNEEL